MVFAVKPELSYSHSCRSLTEHCADETMVARKEKRRSSAADATGRGRARADCVDERDFFIGAATVA